MRQGAAPRPPPLHFERRGARCQQPPLWPVPSHCTTPRKLSQARNRESAARSRQKKESYTAQLEQQVRGRGGGARNLGASAATRPAVDRWRRLNSASPASPQVEALKNENHKLKERIVVAARRPRSVFPAL